MESSAPESQIEINGSLFEGGGQMFRNSLALATILRKSVNISKIRAGRPNPGLNHQLRTGIDIMTQISHCKVEGNSLKSQQVSFVPREIRSGQFKGDCHTAGSIALMIQMVMPSLLFGKKSSSVLLAGGTWVSKSPPVRYFEKILFPLLQQVGANVSIQTAQEGYFPSGGGQAIIEVEPLMGKPLEPFLITEKGKIKKVYIQVIVKQDDEATANGYLKEIKKDVNKIMRTQYSEEEVDAVEFEVEYQYNENLMKSGLSSKIKEYKKNKAKNYHPTDKGPKKIVYGILMFASGENVYYDCSSMAEGKDDEACVESVLKHFKSNFASKSGIDEYLQDQLLIFMLMVKGKSAIKCLKPVSEHTLSCFYVFKEFLPEFKYNVVEEEDSELVTIEIEGLELGKERANMLEGEGKSEA